MQLGHVANSVHFSGFFKYFAQLAFFHLFSSKTILSPRHIRCIFAHGHPKTTANRKIT
jgi:hypothetical protein